MDLTRGSLWHNIWYLSWPMLLIMIFNFFVVFVDVYVAGFISPEVQAAVGFIGILYFFVIIIANAISIGTVAMASRSIGGGDFKQATDTARQSLLFSLLVAVTLTVAGLLFYREIIALAGFPEKIREIAETFLKIFALAMGSNYFLIVSNALFRANGEVKKPLLTMFIVSVVNISGNFVLVFGMGPFPGMGYAGIAAASAIAVTVGTVTNLVLLFFSDWKSIYEGPWRLHLETIEKLIRLGWPAGLLQIAWNAGSIVLYNILGRLGEASITALAAIANGMRIEAAVFLPAFALHMTASVLVGQNLGAGNPDRAESSGWRIASIGAVLLTVLAVIVFIWAEYFASILARDAAVLAETTRYLRINMFAQPFIALSLSLSGALQGAGDTRGPMWVIIVAMWAIRLPLAYVLSLVLAYGAAGVWIAMVTSMFVQSLLMAGRFHGGKWKKIRF
jgi:MATE family multidrug resistance protein